MTHPDRAIEAGARVLCSEMGDDWLHGKKYWRSVMQSVITALAAEGLVVVQRGSVGEHKLGLEWFEQTFGVPLGDKPGRIKADEIRAMIAAAQEQNDAGG